MATTRDFPGSPMVRPPALSRRRPAADADQDLERMLNELRAEMLSRGGTVFSYPSGRIYNARKRVT